MPRSSKSKSHKQSKHSSKDAREHSVSDDDVKMKDRSIKEETSTRASKDIGHSASGDKRKFSSQSREGRDGKDLSGYVNGDASEEYVSSKRRKEKGEGSGGSDRWNGGVDESVDGSRHSEKESKAGCLKNDLEKGLKQKEAKGSGESRSKSSKRHENERKEEITGPGIEKEEAKSVKCSESKRKPEVDSVRKETTDLKEKDHGSERERKRETDLEKKLRSQSGDVGEEKQGKRLKEHTDRSVRSEVRHSDLDKDADKKTRKRKEASSDRDKYADDLIESDEKLVPSKGGDRTKDERHRDAKHKDGGYRDKHREDGDRDERHNKEDKYEAEKDRRRRDDKHREDGYRRKDGKHREDADRDNRYREDKYQQHEERDNRHRGYRVEVERDSRHRDDKYREDNERDGDDKYLGDKDKDGKRRDGKYREDGDEDRQRVKEEKHQEDFEKVSIHREGKHVEESDKGKRPREKYTDDHSQRDRSRDRSDAKRLKDDSHAPNNHSRKGGMHENSSPIYDDRAPRHKDDQGRRRADDKEDRSDSRFQNSKDQNDSEKRSGTAARVDVVNERGKSSTRNSDLERTSNHNRRRGSPSTGPYAARDHYRQSKQDDSKYRDHTYEERARRNRDYSGSAGALDKISSTRSSEKAIQKDESYLVDGSTERRLKSDPRTSAAQVVDKSPSSTSNDRRHISRSEVKRSLDAEDFTPRSGSKDAKDFYGKEGRGNRDLPMDAFAGEEHAHTDGDTLSVSSPFGRGSHLSGSTRLPPPLPFRPGIDSPSVVGSSEDDGRGKPGSRHRRGGESNAGRFQGNSWRGVPNWPSPVANGYIFQHGPAHVSFPPVMQQFPAPPMFGVRPPMELNHPGLPYHMPDADRFSSHGRPIGWRTPMDSSCPPFQTWDSNSAVLGDEANMYGRPEWDQYRNMPMSRGWDTSDMWKGPNMSASVELPSASHKEAHSGQGPGDESLTAQSAQQSQSEQKHVDLEVESKAFSQSSDAAEKITPEDLKILSEEPCSDSKLSRKDDTYFCQAYLSKLDISADLTESDLYEQCTSYLFSDQIIVADVDAPKMLYLEHQAEFKVAAPSRPLLAAASDSVLGKAISLYKEERVVVNFVNGENGSVANIQSKPLDQGKAFSEDVIMEGELEAVEMHPNSHEGVMQASPQKVEGPPILTNHQIHDPVIEGIIEKPEQLIPAVERVSMEVDVVPNLAVEGVSMEMDVVPNVAAVERVSMEMDAVSNLAEDNAVKEISMSPATVEGFFELLPSEPEDSTGTTGKALVNQTSKCDPLLCPDVASEAYGVVSESVILSRIHHSPESTH